VGICVAALVAGIELGLQPLFWHTANGQALYCPYGLNVSVVAMAGGHILVFGWVDFIMTALIVRYLQKQGSFLIK
jgi:cobalt/nickel transport system permease protein